VAVTHLPTQVADNGALLEYSNSNPATGGSYTLTISGVSPKEAPQGQRVQIDIRPGERAEKAIVHLSRARVPVAILSSADFDAMQIDTSTLTFGRSGDEQSLEKCYAKGVDVNRDRRRDMVCLFSVKASNFEPNDVAGVVKGSTTTGTQFQGRGLLKVIELRKSGHRRHGHDVRDDRRRDRDDRDDHDRGKRR
jgi:hypothetical protein